MSAYDNTKGQTVSEPMRLCIVSPTSPFKAEYVEITDAIAAEIVRRGTQPDAIPRHGDGTPISEQTQAGILRGMADSAAGRVTEMDFSAHAGDKLDGDDAAEAAMTEAYLAGPNLTLSGGMRAVLAAIRRGEVPGIRQLSDCNPLIAENEELREKLEKASACANLYKGIHDDYAKHTGRSQDTLSSRHAGKNVLCAALDEIDELRAKLKQAESERDAEKELAANLASDLESARNDFLAANKDFAEAIRQRNAERAEVERQKQINARASDAGRCIIAERDKALAELAAMKERAEKAEELQRIIQKAREDDRGRLQQKCSDWGTYWRASDSHGVKLNIAQATELLEDALGVEVEIDAARAEADALRSEVARLKARKVKLPAIVAYDVIAAIRAAGLEVER